MFHHGLHNNSSKKVFFHWFLMSFMAGSVNAGGFLACQRFVTHVTGFATLAGIKLAEGDWVEVLGILSAPLFFVAGAMLAAHLTISRRHRGLAPRYALTMGLVATCLLLAATAGSFEFFGVFGTDFYLKHDYILVILLCSASGLQNAAITTSSGATIRTTHLTGIVTDLAIGLVEARECRMHPTKFSKIRQSNFLRSGTVLAFVFGGAAGSLLFIRYKYLGFLMPMTIAIYSVFVERHYNLKSSQRDNI